MVQCEVENQTRGSGREDQIYSKANEMSGAGVPYTILFDRGLRHLPTQIEVFQHIRLIVTPKGAVLIRERN